MYSSGSNGTKGLVVVAVDVVVGVIGVLVGIIKPYILEWCKKYLENINIILL